MKYPTRIYYTETDKALMWDRWQKGESLNSIARHFGRSHSSIQGVLARTGGIRPPKRRRSRLALTLAEREEISRGVVAGHSIRTIASSLDRAPSTVSREVNRNGGRREYRANKADQAAWERSHRAKSCKLREKPELARIVAEKLQLQWAPRQIAGWLKITYPDDENYQVSHETIYKSLFIQARGALKKELIKHLRRSRGMRRSRHHTQKTKDHGRITNKVYFCDPQSPWQRGSNENTNGLLRQYFPKGMDLSDVHQNRLNAVARRLNERPRETLHFRTPAERFAQCVASTG
jgi:IS30 family transposase